MADPYVKAFKLPNGMELTSIVIDADEFQALVDEIDTDTKMPNGIPIPPEQIQAIRDAGHIPLIQKGTKTAFIFDRYGVETDKCAVITRGKGKEIAARLFSN